MLKVLATINKTLVGKAWAITLGPDKPIPSPRTGGGGPPNGEANYTEGSFNIGQAGKGVIPHAGTGNYEANFWDWVGRLMGVVMPIAALLVLAYLIWGAVEWITSEGDSGKLQKARNKMMHAVIGLIILASVTAIFAALQQFLGVCLIGIGGACK